MGYASDTPFRLGIAHLYVLRTCAPCWEPYTTLLLMAIYHYSVSVIKRSSGKSAVAAIAYRAAEKIVDLRTGLTHDYTKKTGVDHSEIITPILPAGENSWLTDRFKLWNKVETSELRHDSQLAREINIAIPVELDRDKQIALVREYVKTNYVDRGMVADINFHDLESNNPHVHIMLTMRDLIAIDGQVKFGNKNRDWNSKNLLIEQRQSWERLTNQYLDEAGYDIKIDCRTLEEQGIKRLPQIHLGVHVSAMRARGIPTDRGDEYDQIEQINNDVRQHLEEIYRDESALATLSDSIVETQTDLARELEKIEKEARVKQDRIEKEARDRRDKIKLLDLETERAREFHANDRYTLRVIDALYKNELDNIDRSTAEKILKIFPRLANSIIKTTAERLTKAEVTLPEIPKNEPVKNSSPVTLPETKKFEPVSSSSPVTQNDSQSENRQINLEIWQIADRWIRSAGNPTSVYLGNYKLTRQDDSLIAIYDLSHSDPGAILGLKMVDDVVGSTSLDLNLKQSILDGLRNRLSTTTTQTLPPKVNRSHPRR